MFFVKKDILFKLLLFIPYPVSKWVYRLSRKLLYKDRREPYFEKAVKYIRKKRLEGDFLEFGVYRGASFIAFIKYLEMYPSFKQMKYYAFDSFEGLPAGEGSIWKAKDFLCSARDFIKCLYKTGVPVEKTVITKGDYLDVLTGEIKIKNGLLKASIIHIDCDLYLSTKAVLDFIDDLLLPGSIIIFDNYYINEDDIKGEKKAFEEFHMRDKFVEFYSFAQSKAFLLKEF